MAEWLFRVRDPWGDEVGLTRRRWEKLLAKHQELDVAAPSEQEILDLIAGTVVRPDRVYEGASAPETKVFYNAPGRIATRPYTRCRVAVVVRYTNQPASLASVYLPVEIKANLGNLIYERGRMTVDSNFTFEYDEEEDILYVAAAGRSIGEPAVTLETENGHLVRLDPESGDFVGAEVIGYKARWEGRDLTFEWTREQPQSEEQHQIRLFGSAVPA